ncbi:MAG TPA: glutaredoxin family protein [Anaerolineae bacterium]|nr:glutaredoxin family protein [Anaerolineae bacterium]
MTDSIILYASDYCSHSWAVKSFLAEYDVPVTIVNIDDDPQAREQLKAINRGYASVPTLVFPDGRQLTEPSIRQVRAELNLESPGLIDRALGFLGI